MGQKSSSKIPMQNRFVDALWSDLLRSFYTQQELWEQFMLHISLVSEDFGLLQLCCGAVSDTSHIPPVSFGWIRIATWKTHLESRTVQYRSQAWRACHRWRGHRRWDSLKRSQVSLKCLESVSEVSLQCLYSHNNDLQNAWHRFSMEQTVENKGNLK